MIYLDNNATTRPSPAVAEAVSRALTEFWHNPSSVHRAGQAARQQVELARKEAAELLNAAPREIVFTSGGTEAIDLAVRGVIGSVSRTAPNGSAPPIVTSSRVEHAAVRDLLEDLAKRRQIEVRWAPISREGIVDVAVLTPLLTGASLAVFQWANNETGSIQPVDEIGRACRGHRVHFHCDAMQWVGKEPASVASNWCDSLSFAPHKFHGPKGVGVLWTRRGMGLAPTIHGTQELGRRGGTENVPGILGAGVACREARQWLAQPAARRHLAAQRDRFERSILAAAAGTVVNSPREDAHRLWNTTNIGFPNLEAEALLLMLSERGVCASAGAACSSGSLDPSPVLLAMGIPEPIAHGSLRFSISKDTTEAELQEAAATIARCATDLRATL